MTSSARPLSSVYQGWEGYQQSLVHAIAPLSAEHLAWRGAPGLRSLSEIAAHIGDGRIRWFLGVLGAGSEEQRAEVAALAPTGGLVGVSRPAQLVGWLELSWAVVEEALAGWTTDNLDESVKQSYQGQTYSIPRQWVIWRVMAHDLHHGGELALSLGMQGIAIPELGDQGGHLTPVEPA
jgi:uncharacterized damage-inducible protein DinB